MRRIGCARVPTQAWFSRAEPRPCSRRGPLVRWLLLKDLRILRRSPVMVALLVIYPIVIAVLIGFALSRAPDKPKVALYNGLSVSASTIELGGRRLNLA